MFEACRGAGAQTYGCNYKRLSVRSPLEKMKYFNLFTLLLRQSWRKAGSSVLTLALPILLCTVFNVKCFFFSPLRFYPLKKPMLRHTIPHFQDSPEFNAALRLSERNSKNKLNIIINSSGPSPLGEQQPSRLQS